MLVSVSLGWLGKVFTGGLLQNVSLKEVEVRLADNRRKPLLAGAHTSSGVSAAGASCSRNSRDLDS